MHLLNVATLKKAGLQMIEQGRYKEALFALDQAVKVDPINPEIFYYRSYCLKNLKEPKKALLEIEKVLNVFPNNDGAWNAKGAILQDLGQDENSLECFEQALLLRPNNAEAWNNKGIALSNLKKFHRSIEAYDMALNILPDYPEALWNKSHAALTQGNFLIGWELFEARWKRRDKENYRHSGISRLTSIENLEGKTVLVWAEQGYGDTLQFCRYIKLLENTNANIIFEVQMALKNFIKDSFACEVVGINEEIPSIDYQIPLLSLPKFFTKDIESIPTFDSYLMHHQIKNEPFPRGKNSQRKNIGIACSGNPENQNNLKRSIPLKYFDFLNEYGVIHLIQTEINPHDELFLKNSKLVSHQREIKDFQDSARLVAEMDLIITVDSSLAHLAGGLGKETYILLPWAAEWRWLNDRLDSPWYPKAKLIRQTSKGDWESVFFALENILKTKK